MQPRRHVKELSARKIQHRGNNVDVLYIDCAIQQIRLGNIWSIWAVQTALSLQQLLGKGPQGICRDAGICWSTNREGKRSQQGFQAPWLKCKFQEEWLGTWWLSATFQIQHGHHLREVYSACALPGTPLEVGCICISACMIIPRLHVDGHAQARALAHTYKHAIYQRNSKFIYVRLIIQLGTEHTYVCTHTHPFFLMPA